ncbi:hypothetical protein P0082_01005 [Candidatus Haliotispira prima]|uniref:Uncharacterized protein n=1 Tax=Candidatus Haliotispira prima TaxID=3034016 RepID=A0ABY8MHG4_9SPIO|nr:hypothetical protein P0082_01005 [Candidatus Haliotispira prima]
MGLHYLFSQNRKLAGSAAEPPKETGMSAKASAKADAQMGARISAKEYFAKVEAVAGFALRPEYRGRVAALARQYRGSAILDDLRACAKKGFAEWLDKAERHFPVSETTEGDLKTDLERDSKADCIFAGIMKDLEELERERKLPKQK